MKPTSNPRKAGARKPGSAVATRWFTLDGARERDPDVASWFSAPRSPLRLLARHWFQQMRAAGPDVLEVLHDGHPTACVAGVALGYVNAYADHINVGFFFGSALAAPPGLLEGSGRYMRHVKVRPGVFNREAELQALLALAYADLKARLAAQPPA